jgi:2-polyprenyl-3-methyl-5-hydroxy-6-metoxy-1,4-benzoquinol methylase
MFEDYLYVSGTTQTGREHFKGFAEVTSHLHGSAKTVLDVGCNDGTQLDYYKELGLETYGVDPARNLWELSHRNHRVCVQLLQR